MISHCRNLTQSGWREQDLFCCHLEVRSIFSIDYMYETAVCCSRMIKDFTHITYPFLFLPFSPDTDYRFLLNFKFPPKMCAVWREELDLIWGKKRRIKRSVKSGDKNLIISPEHLIPLHTNTTTHPGNRLGSHSNTLCV